MRHPVVRARPIRSGPTYLQQRQRRADVLCRKHPHPALTCRHCRVYGSLKEKLEREGEGAEAARTKKKFKRDQQGAGKVQDAGGKLAAHRADGLVAPGAAEGDAGSAGHKSAKDRLVGPSCDGSIAIAL